MKIILVLAAILLVGGGIIFFQNRGSQPTQQPAIQSEITPTPEIFPTTSPTPIDTDSPVPNQRPAVNGLPQTSGVTRGQITTNYLVPAAPGQQGEAQIDAIWNNLIPGKPGVYTAAICVSVNGQSPTLMSVINKQNGSTSINVPWISQNANYNFLLYDQHGGELTNCQGTELSAADLNTNLGVPPPLPTGPTGAPRGH
jgi:hypothetical protein